MQLIVVPMKTSGFKHPLHQVIVLLLERPEPIPLVNHTKSARNEVISAQPLQPDAETSGVFYDIRKRKRERIVDNR